jgi:acyl carrier protein
MEELTMSVAIEDTATLNELRTIIADVLDIEEEQITEDANFVNDLDVDSLMALEVMVALEKKYQIKLSEQELRQITCLRNVYEMLKAKKG